MCHFIFHGCHTSHIAEGLTQWISIALHCFVVHHRYNTYNYDPLSQYVVTCSSLPISEDDRWKTRAGDERGQQRAWSLSDTVRWPPTYVSNTDNSLSSLSGSISGFRSLHFKCEAGPSRVRFCTVVLLRFLTVHGYPLFQNFNFRLKSSVNRLVE